MRNIDKMTAGLKAGECILFNENGSEFRFKKFDGGLQERDQPRAKA